MKRWIALLVTAVLLVSVATAVVAVPLHIGGGPMMCSSPLPIGDEPVLLSAPLHIGGGPILE